MKLLINQSETQSQILQKEFNFEILSPDQRLRDDGSPSGLKNIANGIYSLQFTQVCYLNSLIQTYFHNPLFVTEILQFEFPLSLSFERLIQTNESKAKRIKSSINLVIHLQKLFAYMVFSSRKYVDPFAVVIHVVDEFGNRFTIGDQKDLAEFNLQFLACIEEGLKYDERKVRQAEEDTKSPSKIHQSLILDLRDDFDDTLLSQSSESTKPAQQESYTKVKRSYSQILASSQSLISSLFFGKSKESVQFSESGQMKESSDESEQIFLPIILGVQHKDLYTSWEANTRLQIENYRTSNGTLTYAEKHTWITKIPEALLFQLQRVGYDPVRGLVKQNNQLKFEKEIYADRFLLENKDLSLRNQQKLDQLKKRKKDLEVELLQYENYSDSGLSVLKILDHTNTFLSQNILTNSKPFQSLLKRFRSLSPSPIKRNLEEDFSFTSPINTEVQQIQLQRVLSQLPIFEDEINLQKEDHLFTLENSSDSKGDKNISTTPTKNDLVPQIDPIAQTENTDPVELIKDKEQLNEQINDPFFDKIQSMNEKETENMNNHQEQKVSIFTNLRSSETDIDTVLQPARQDFELQLEKADSAEINQRGQRVSKISESLDIVRKKLEDICKDLKDRIKAIGEEIDILYGSLKKHKYIIHSILIHEGAADTGHYYAYIYKHAKNIWYKFNDIHVSIVQEDKVFMEAYGDGKSKTNAYCIVYHRVGGKINSCLNQPNYYDRIGSDLKLIVKEEHQNPLGTQSYAQLINDQMRQEVLNDNIKFEQELQEYQFSHLADSIADNYNHKFQFVNEHVRKFKDTQTGQRACLPPLCNFSVFLRYQFDEANDMVKWSILDSAIRELTNKQITIFDLKKHPTMLLRLQFNFSNLNEYKAPSSLTVNNNVAQDLEIRLEQYISKLQGIKSALYLFSQIEHNHWKQSLSAVKTILAVNEQQDYIYLMASDIHSVQLLMLTSQLFNRCDDLPLSRLWQVIELVVAYSPLIKRGSIILKQIQLMLVDFYKLKGHQIFDQEQMAQFQNYIKAIPECRSYSQLEHYYKEGEKEYEEQINCELYEKDFFYWKINEEDELIKQLDSGLHRIYSRLKKWINLHQTLIHDRQLIYYDKRVESGFHKSIMDEQPSQIQSPSDLGQFVEQQQV